MLLGAGSLWERRGGHGVLSRRGGSMRRGALSEVLVLVGLGVLAWRWGGRRKRLAWVGSALQTRGLGGVVVYHVWMRSRDSTHLLALART